MQTIIVGLGNPGKEYEKTRHNSGRMVAQLLAKNEKFDEFVFNKKLNALVTDGVIDGEKVTLMLPETMMNNSGKAVIGVVKSVKAAKNLLVIRDDLDLPVGTVKMTFARGSGGHKGVESIMRALKTDQFAQLKIGISGIGKKHQAKKVSGDEKVLKHVIGKFSPKEEPLIKKAIKKAALAARLFVTDGLEKATMEANTR
jgi:peptidyl-tRNA hydrolase, PTH1 family